MSYDNHILETPFTFNHRTIPQHSCYCFPSAFVSGHFTTYSLKTVACSGTAGRNEFDHRELCLMRAPYRLCIWQILELLFVSYSQMVRCFYLNAFEGARG